MAFKVIGPRKEGIAFCEAVKGQSHKADYLIGFFNKEAFGLLKPEGVQIQDKPRSYDGASGKASSGGKMAV